MLKKLIEKYGKDKVNTLTKYPSILTLYENGEKEVLLEELTTQVRGEKDRTAKMLSQNMQIKIQLICYATVSIFFHL